MEKFLNQFNLTPMQRINFEAFIFRAADHLVKGYYGGVWESRNIGGALVLMIPGKDDQQFTLTVEMSGNVVTTTRLTASAAFTCLVTNWFWNMNANKLDDGANAAFQDKHYALRDAVYGDQSTHGIVTDDYFTLTD